VTRQTCVRSRVCVVGRWREVAPPSAGTRLAALRRARDPRLAFEKLRFLNASIADRKGGRHSTGVRHWITYCVYGLGVSPIPDPLDTSVQHQRLVEERLEDFAVWVVTTRPSGRQVSYKSMGKYISSVRSWYRRWYLAQLGLGSSGSRIKDVLKGYAREIDQPPPMERVGCTPEDLAGGMAIVMLELPKMEQHMWRSALTFGMSALARACEIAIDAGRHELFDPTQHMTASDVREVRRGDRRHAAVRMRKRKNLQVLRGKDQTVVVAAGGVHFDAAGLLLTWLEARRGAGIADGRPLFCHANGRAITTDEVRAMVRRVMAAAGRNPALYGGHSLRIGGATAAHAAGVPPALIRLMGRWASDVYEIYCRLSIESALGVGEAIASAQVTAATEAFHDECLELLPSEVQQLSGIFGAEEDEDEEVS
jgi:hypothetical protein